MSGRRAISLYPPAEDVEVFRCIVWNLSDAEDGLPLSVHQVYEASSARAAVDAAVGMDDEVVVMLHQLGERRLVKISVGYPAFDDMPGAVLSVLHEAERLEANFELTGGSL
jgi:hypothetical protein